MQFVGRATVHLLRSRPKRKKRRPGTGKHGETIMAPQANTTEESVGEDETRESKTGPRNNNHKVFKSSKDPTAHLASLTYLIVDDSRFNRKIVREAPSLFGVRRTRDAKDAIEAMKILSKETIDLVLTDYEMPLVTGVELIPVCKKNHR